MQPSTTSEPPTETTPRLECVDPKRLLDAADALAVDLARRRLEIARHHQLLLAAGPFRLVAPGLALLEEVERASRKREGGKHQADTHSNATRHDAENARDRLNEGSTTPDRLVAAA